MPRGERESSGKRRCGATKDEKNNNVRKRGAGADDGAAGAVDVRSKKSRILANGPNAAGASAAAVATATAATTRTALELKGKKHTSSIPTTILLNTGARIPTMQLGTYRLKGDHCRNVVRMALTLDDKAADPYRGVDTAHIYGNERAVGNAVAASGVPRDSMFVQTKLWRSHQGSAQVVHSALRASLNQLKMAYVDLWLLHWPGPGRHLNYPPVRQCKKGQVWTSMAREAMTTNDMICVPATWTPAMRLETWESMTQMTTGKNPLARAVGLCNVSARMLRDLIGHCQNKKLPLPAVVQNECHPYLPATELRALCEQHGIIFQAYGSLGSEALTKQLFEDATVVRIAERHECCPAQVLLRWAVQHRMAVIPKSESAVRQCDNARVMTMTPLTDDDMKAIDGLDRTKDGQNVMVAWRREYDPDHYCF